MILDFELCHRISPELAEDYKFGLEFIQIDPETTLSKFRRIAERVCLLIAHAQHIEFSSNELAKHINELHEYQIINFNQKEMLDRLRRLGNKAVHAGEVNVGMSDVKGMIKGEQKRLKEESIKARKVVIELLQDLHHYILKEHITDDIEMTELADNSWKEDLSVYHLSDDYKDKLKLGQIYKRLALDLAIEDSYEHEPKFNLNHKFMNQSVAMSYEAACHLSVNTNIHNHPPGQPIEPFSDDDPYDDLKRFCDPECLFHFWSSLQTSGNFNPQFYSDTDWMLEVSAKKGFPKAMAQYGITLMKSGNNTEAKDWLTRAAEYDEDLALLGLFGLSGQDLTEDSKKQMLEYLESGTLPDRDNPYSFLLRGVELGGAECLTTLGRVAHGFDDEYSEKLLLEAIKAGSIKAYHYYFSDFLGVMTAQQKRLHNTLNDAVKNLTEAILGSIDIYNENQITFKKEKFPFPLKPGSRAKFPSRNEPCFCGSGLKYKKCCLT